MSETSQVYLKLGSNSQNKINGHAGFWNGTLGLFFEDTTVSDVLMLILTPNVLDHIEFHSGSSSVVYEGFTIVKTILNFESDRRVEVHLIGGDRVEVANVEGMENTDGADEASSSDGSESGSVPT